MIKSTNDYVDEIHKKYPYVNKKEIRKIINSGLHELWRLTDRNMNVKVGKHPYNAYFGNFVLNSKKTTSWHIETFKRKQRLFYKESGKEYDGYYYFGMSDEEFDKNKKNIEQAGGYIALKDVTFFKIPNELRINYKKNHFFKTCFPYDYGFFFKKEDFKTNSFEYFAVREGKSNKIKLLG